MTQQTTQKFPRRYRSLNAWAGYWVPGTAVVGASVYDDHSRLSVTAEIRRLRCEVLTPNGIKSKSKWGASSNIFCGKRWLCVAPEDFARAAELVKPWLAETRIQTEFIHSAL